jgi:hypothetical protein
MYFYQVFCNPQSDFLFLLRIDTLEKMGDILHCVALLVLGTSSFLLDLICIFGFIIFAGGCERDVVLCKDWMTYVKSENENSKHICNIKND